MAASPLTKKKIKELFQAIEDKSLDVVERLVAEHADALEAVGDKWPVVEMLLQAGADRENVGPAGATTSQCAATNKHCYSAKVLSLLGVA